MRNNTPRIPSEFVLLDENAFNSDTYANVRDMQRVRDNHNILLARRCRRPFYNQRICASDGTRAVSFWEVRPAASGAPMVVMSVPFRRSSPHIKEVQLAIYAYGVVANPPRVYPVVSALGQAPIINENLVLTLDSASISWKTINLPVPRTARSEPMLMLSLCVANQEGATGSKPARTVVDAGQDWATGASMDDTVGYIVWSPSDPAIEPRTIVAARTDIDAALNDLIIVDRPWNIIPTAGVTTLESRSPAGITVESINIWERGLTSFEDSLDWEFLL